MTPKYQHDCEACQFLGHHRGHDLYVCRNPRNEGLSSIIARFADQDSHYASFPMDVMRTIAAGEGHAASKTTEILLEAYKRAQ